MAKKNNKKSKAQKISEALPTNSIFATPQNDITIANFSDILSPLDDTLIDQGGIKGLKLYDEIERDTHAYAVLQKRRHQLIGREWIVEPGGEGKQDIEAADFIKDVFRSINFDLICQNLLDATLKGFAISEVIYVRDGRHICIDNVQSLDQRRFVFDLDWQPRLLTTAAPMLGQELPTRKFITHRFGVKGNNPYGLGLGSKLFWPVLFKRNGVAYWMKFLERFASPIPVGKYPIGTLPAQQRDLMQVLEGMNHSSAIMVPLGTDLESFEAKRTGNASYENWCTFWNSEISKATLGETLTTEMGANGARAASETHASILDMLVDSDADLLSGTLNNGLIRWLCDFNYPTAALPQVWRPRPSNELEQENLRLKIAERQMADLDALDRSRELGFEPADIKTHVEGIFGAPIRVISNQPAQKKSLKT